MFTTGHWIRRVVAKRDLLRRAGFKGECLMVVVAHAREIG